MTLDTSPYKGVQDYYPEDMAIQKHIFGIWRKIAESYGYVEYSASILEPAELYKSKTSEEIVSEQTFIFKDRGDREIVLRPEMTPTLARMVAARRKNLKFPLRWYSIPNIFRYERPQRGRRREHWQLNCDILGIENIKAEIEIISLTYAIMEAFGAKKDDFQIKINDRKLLEKSITPLLKDPSQYKRAINLIDKKDKISEGEFSAGWADISDKPFAVFAGDSINDILSKLGEEGIKNVIFDPFLTRGFDYYTGIVFEVFDTHPENRRSLFGGGRYDNLLELFDVEPVPAVGFGMGDITLKDFLETHKLGPYA